MKVIKRDGRAVEYNSDKIVIAINKANAEVSDSDKISNKQIDNIIKYIESLDKKRILVEDIQDIIEKKLMEYKKYALAKKYVIYRYTRALVRKSNTTDESIISLIKGNGKENVSLNKNNNTLASQRDLISCEVSKDLARRVLLPDKIIDAMEEGILYFHNMDYFVQPMFNCSFINIFDMLDNGTVLNGKVINSPNSFRTACVVTSQIINEILLSQYGGTSIDVKSLSKYLRKSYDDCYNDLLKFKDSISSDTIKSLVDSYISKEVSCGIQSLFYQINTFISINGKTPCVSLFLHLDKDDLYLKETKLIIEEIFKQASLGILNVDGSNKIIYPKLIYVLNEDNNLSGGEDDYLTRLSIKCNSTSLVSYVSEKVMKRLFEDNVFSPMGYNSFLSLYKENGSYKFLGRFNQGVVTINLPQIAILSNGDSDKFFKLLDERLDLCRDALMCKYYSFLGTTCDISPINYMYGAIARDLSSSKIDKYLKKNYSTISLGYMGLYEAVKVMLGVSNYSEEGFKFSIKILKYMSDKCIKWKKEMDIGFNLYGMDYDQLGILFSDIDREKYGLIKGINDKGYTSSYHNNCDKVDIYERLRIEGLFQQATLGGSSIYVNNDLDIENIIKYVYDNVLCINITNKEEV